LRGLPKAILSIQHQKYPDHETAAGAFDAIQLVPDVTAVRTEGEKGWEKGVSHQFRPSESICKSPPAMRPYLAGAEW
jgi:hypothetical protein